MNTMLSVLIPFLLTSYICSAASFTAASTSYYDVNSAVASATRGDTVHIPAGTVAWTNVLTLTNAISIIGAGTNSTIITNLIPWNSPWSTSWRPPLIKVMATTNASMRISGIAFECRTNQGILFDQNSVAGDPPLYGVRVDRCLFRNANSYAIWFDGTVDGVSDHCTFIDPRIGLGRNAADSVEWSRFSAPRYGLGTTNTWIVESCAFVWTTNSPSSQPIDCGKGSHYVFRFNTLDYTAANTGQSHDGLDLHGNNYPQSSTGWRGSIFSEIYGNTVNWGSLPNGFRFAKLRGGTSMVFSNTVTASVSRDQWIVQLDEEETWQAFCYSYPSNNLVLTNHPGQDQVTNTFIWSNTVNGSLSNNVAQLYAANPSANPVTTNTSINPVSLAISEWRDYWQKAPSSGHATNSGGGIDVMASYTPLVFPHPRVTAEDTVMTIAIGTATVGTIRAP